jgi:magnesium chelatase family protein
LLDRIDLRIEVPRLPPASYLASGDGEATAEVRERVVLARDRQRRRAQKLGCQGIANATLAPRDLRRSCALDVPAERFLEQALERLGLSARSHERILKVARTLADLEGAEAVTAGHLAEALQFRGAEAGAPGVPA